MISRLTVVHSLDAWQASKIIKIHYGCRDLATALITGDELRLMVRKSATAAAKEFLCAGVSSSAITVALPEQDSLGLKGDIVREMRVVFEAQLRVVLGLGTMECFTQSPTR